MRLPALSFFVCIGFAAPAYSQTATQYATGKPADTYSYLKRALQEVHAGREDAEVRNDPLEKVVPLTACNEASEYIGYEGKRSSIVEKIANLAFDVLYMQAAMQVAGYPASIWSSDLDQYERDNLAGIRQFQWGVVDKAPPAKRKLAKKLNDYKKSSKGRYKDVIPEAEGCGAGEVSVEIRTSPSAQRVQYINSIKYNLCVFQGLDPRGDSCNLWADYGAPRGNGVLMSGNYKVRAIWSDGTAAYRDLKVDDLSENKNGNLAFVVTKQ